MAKSGRKIIELHFPMGGVYEKVAFQHQAPYYSARAQNVRPGDAILGRERGGSRPGVGKAFSAGMGGVVRMLNTLRYIEDEVLKNRIVGSAGGVIYQETSGGNLASVSTGSSLASDRPLWSTDYQQDLFIADWEEKIAEGTNGTMVGGTNAVVTITTSANSPFTISFTNGGKTLTTTAIAGDAEPYEVQERLEALDNIFHSNVAVGGSAGSYTVTFQGALSGRAVGAMTVSAGSVAVTTAGAPGSFSGGTFTGVNGNDYVLVITDCADYDNMKVMVTVNGSPTAGGWMLEFLDGWTPEIPFDAGAHRVKTALCTIENVELDDIDVIGDDGGPYVIEIKGQYAGRDISPPIGAAAGLRGGSKRAVSVRVLSKGGPIGTHQITSAGGSLTVGATGSGTGCTWYIQRAPKIYSPNTETMVVFAADEGKGFVPTGCPLICRYRDRIVLAGATEAPHQWYMSRQGDPYDWDYSQDDVGAAVSGQNSEASRVGEMITALIPHADECLVFGCRNSIWIVRGDPAQGGHIDNISPEIGIVSQGAWCATPTGELVFLSSDGVYMMPAGCGAGRPVSISREYIPERLLNIDPTTTTVSMAYDVRDRGVHIFVSRNNSAETTHYWLDWEQKGFWPATYQTAHEPMAVHARRDTTSDYSEVMLGCRDGYVRRHQDDLEKDYTNGDVSFTIKSYVYYGPILLSDSMALYNDGMLVELIGELAKNSGPVHWQLFSGATIECALDSNERARGTWSCDCLNPKSRPHVRGAAAFLKVSNGSSNKEWSVEHITAVIEPSGERLKS